ncbi:MAG: DUF4397 domain-containing protein [Bacteroidetes bacterium]|nr:MAG: DUF4397 domain-containing protein [Bacteroidota bacterium]
MKNFILTTLALLLFSAGAYAQAQLQVIHNSPTPGTNAGPVVDIYVNGQLLTPLTAVAFRNATPFLSVPTGVDIEVAVAVSPSMDVSEAIATFSLGQLTNGVSYTAIATGIVGSTETPFTIEVGAGRTAANDPTEVDVQVFHGSPGAPNVDIDARFVGELVGDLAYGSFSTDYLNLEPEEYLLDVVVAGTDNIAATFTADLTSLVGGAATVFASGLFNNTPEFGLYAALPDGMVT